jgi:Zn-dependent membrane protease YugP
MFFDPAWLFIVGPALIISLWAQFRVKGTLKKYSQIRSASGRTGAEVAREILHRNGISGVSVEQAGGFFSDHYDPSKKILRLSPEVHSGTSVTALGVAAHEAGHAIQHADNYAPLVIRQAIAPVAVVSSNLATVLIIIGFLMQAISVTWIGVIAFGVAVVFTLITLPVEFNASKRAKEILPKLGIVSTADSKGVAVVLGAAAMTYVAAALYAVSELLYWLLRLGVLGGSRED